ncbi:hypothetical protein DZG00_10755 [Clavibacter lycopersici]|uniref:Uncharacterized protein n=1 Tax=Clavibacter lycopersici TaxID=2301718 RepID=A0A399T7E7_9MICO|nr:DUF6584 family protein [Clavibacter lycopersici]RIJ50954.1 hypothetical protein DZG00_10755 [Clavibacter lycopersici]RIJ59460.1 hypothetical protein DZG02_11835 [Clavibacter lycopersici]
MDEAQAIARAEAMRAAGERAKGIQSLRSRVEAHPAERAARRLLAEWYRDDGTHDQAGRWGVVFPGWTTTYERDRTARLFAASYPVGGDVRAFLHLPTGSIPEDARLLAARIPVQRELLSRRASPPTPGPLPGPPGPLDGYATVVGIIAVVLLLVDVAVTFVGALLGASMSGFTRWTTLAVIVLAVVAIVLAWVNALRRPARPTAEDVDEGVLPADPRVPGVPGVPGGSCSPTPWS